MDLEGSFYLVERESRMVDLGTRLRGPCQVGAGMWWGGGKVIALPYSGQSLEVTTTVAEMKEDSSPEYDSSC